MEDEALIRRAELWATGATIHNVNSLIGEYRACIECANRGDPADIAYGREGAIRLAKTLNDFMAHGDYKRARRDNPPPGGWSRRTYE